jgi:hypothetical protein
MGMKQSEEDKERKNKKKVALELSDKGGFTSEAITVTNFTDHVVTAVCIVLHFYLLP